MSNRAGFFYMPEASFISLNNSSGHLLFGHIRVFASADFLIEHLSRIMALLINALLFNVVLLPWPSSMPSIVPSCSSLLCFVDVLWYEPVSDMGMAGMLMFVSSSCTLIMVQICADNIGLFLPAPR